MDIVIAPGWRANAGWIDSTVRFAAGAQATEHVVLPVRTLDDRLTMTPGLWGWLQVPPVLDAGQGTVSATPQVSMGDDGIWRVDWTLVVDVQVDVMVNVWCLVGGQSPRHVYGGAA